MRRHPLLDQSLIDFFDDGVEVNRRPIAIITAALRIGTGGRSACRLIDCLLNNAIMGRFRYGSTPLPRPKGSAALLEARRRQGLRLLEEGYSLNEAARLIGSAASSVMRWRDARDSGGEEALKVRFSSGRPSTLTARQRKRIVKRLLRGAMANGFATELWTTRVWPP